MHYANGFEPDVLDYDSKRESQHSLNFAEMVRARQSLDLDDVMPFNMAEAGEKSVPPVPPLPSKAFLTQNKVKADFLSLFGTSRRSSERRRRQKCSVISSSSVKESRETSTRRFPAKDALSHPSRDVGR